MTDLGFSQDSDRLMTPAEVASLFRVDPKTVTRWANSGKLTPIKTLGGHRRYRESQVRDLLQGTNTTRYEESDGVNDSEISP